MLNLTNGEGVHVVYESVGSTIEESFQALRKTGTLVFFGMSGGNPSLSIQECLWIRLKHLQVATYGMC